MQAQRQQHDEINYVYECEQEPTSTVFLVRWETEEELRHSVAQRDWASCAPLRNGLEWSLRCATVTSCYLAVQRSRYCFESGSTPLRTGVLAANYSLPGPGPQARHPSKTWRNMQHWALPSVTSTHLIRSLTWVSPFLSRGARSLRDRPLCKHTIRLLLCAGRHHACMRKAHHTTTNNQQHELNVSPRLRNKTRMRHPLYPCTCVGPHLIKPRTHACKDCCGVFFRRNSPSPPVLCNVAVRPRLLPQSSFLHVCAAARTWRDAWQCSEPGSSRHEHKNTDETGKWVSGPISRRSHRPAARGSASTRCGTTSATKPPPTFLPTDGASGS